MTTPQPLAHRERVADWPRITATVRADGTGNVTINGTERACQAPSVDELRIGIIARCVAIAVRLRRPVRLTAIDGDQRWRVAVRPEGVVQLVDENGTISPAGTLSVQTGRCRGCHCRQPVTAPRCRQCGTGEPHRVEVDPPDQGTDFR